MRSTNKNVFFQINEEGFQRIVNIEDIRCATFAGDQLSIFWGKEQSITFRGEPARRLWRILSDYSILIYDFEANKNAETLLSQGSDVPPNE
ncbi:hypothetical protein WDZ92_11175 [Nostoc sp. NIES-2111]